MTYITCYAAKALLARVYLFYTGYYGASDLVGVVTKNRPWQGWKMFISSKEYDLVPEFKNLWPAASQHRFRVSLSSSLLTPATETSKPCSP